ncbi:hypothetical protein LOTGIDRAFT_159433 [Lottia gigantea]|uniref:RING-type E3 ubiquitin transferase n=1 Tax=Lottia gigantea TaxID=225164 RepID=V4AJY5_LOTGI|nr:hypothetical protein LOTGIDRAFT_159433 [Lottia gigantea]ESO97402.1 hypothetical protein LOTGIDRAFT_159433 [Lottia gigantea]
MDEAKMEPYAQLVSLTDVDSPAIVVSKSPFVIGRHSDCDIPLVGNKYVSRLHCSIKKDEKGIILEDGSSNGTLLNKEVKLSSYERAAEYLKHGDEFYVVYKKYDPSLNVGFVYQELKQLKKEEEESEEESDVNVGDSTLVDDDLNVVPSPDPKLKRLKSVEGEEPPSKRTKTSCETKEDQKGKSESKDDALAESLQCMICQEILHDCIRYIANRINYATFLFLDPYQNYLESKNITIKELLKICLEKKESGVYNGRATYAEVNLNSNSVLCYACGLRNFKELVYQYRCDIPEEDLPDEVNKKPNCYWGKNCRTQKNKPQHATRFNHICEQTRTT